MREIKIELWCNLCYAGGIEQVPATVSFHGVIADGESGPIPEIRFIDTCDQCAETVRGVQLLLASGSAVRPVPPVKRRQHLERVTCPICSGRLTRQGLVSHAKGHGIEPHVQPSECPECGQHSPSRQGMGSHRKAAHGFDAIDDLLALMEHSITAPPKRRSNGGRRRAVPADA